MLITKQFREKYNMKNNMKELSNRFRKCEKLVFFKTEKFANYTERPADSVLTIQSVLQTRS